MWVLKTGFNFTLRLSQISDLFCSLIHLHTSIYRTLAYFPLEALSTLSYSANTTLDTLSNPKISRLSFVVQSMLIFLFIKIFGALRAISCVQADVFPTGLNLKNWALSSGIILGLGIYHPLGAYCSLQSWTIGHVERGYPTISLTFKTLYYVSFVQGNLNSHRNNHWCLRPPPGFMLQFGFVFFNIESIHRFTLNLLAICSYTSYPFGFTSKIKMTPLDILKFLVSTLRNQDKKFAFIQVY